MFPLSLNVRQIIKIYRWLLKIPTITTDLTGVVGEHVSMELVGHLAYTLGVMSFLLKEILWLRVLTVVSASLCIVFNYFALTEPMWVPIYWNAALAGINLVQIGILLFERTEIPLSERDRWLHENVFSSLTQREFRKLVQTATTKCSHEGETLILEGELSDDLLLITKGICTVKLREDSNVALRDGDFVGEMSFLTGKAASATVTAQGEVELLAWNREKLQRLLCKAPDLQTALRLTLSGHLSDKIQRMSKESQQHPSVVPA